MKQPCFVQQTVLSNLEDFLKQKQATILSLDPDALHRMRVSGRRLRINLWSFKQLFPSREYNKIRKTIRKICKPLNQARDLDTGITILSKLKAQKYVVNYFRNRRIKLQPQIEHNLSKMKESRLRERINKCLKNPKVLLNRESLMKTGGDRINKKLDEMLRFAEYANDPEI
jgi:CHAD domain-containing protein